MRTTTIWPAYHPAAAAPVRAAAWASTTVRAARNGSRVARRAPLEVAAHRSGQPEHEAAHHDEEHPRTAAHGRGTSEPLLVIDGEDGEADDAGDRGDQDEGLERGSLCAASLLVSCITGRGSWG